MSKEEYIAYIKSRSNEIHFEFEGKVNSNYRDSILIGMLYNCIACIASLMLFLLIYAAGALVSSLTGADLTELYHKLPTIGRAWVALVVAVMAAVTLISAARSREASFLRYKQDAWDTAKAAVQHYNLELRSLLDCPATQKATCDMICDVLIDAMDKISKEEEKKICLMDEYFALMAHSEALNSNLAIAEQLIHENQKEK